MSDSLSGPEGEAVADSLLDEHVVLRREVLARARPVLRAAGAGAWPATELTELVNYLQLEVLRQLTDEEWLLFRRARTATEELARLRRDHLELRLTIDRLTEAAIAREALNAAQLAAATQDLLDQLEAHLLAEEQVLEARGDEPASTARLGSQPHEWYGLVEAPVIDLDRLPGPLGVDAVFDRLLRLRAEEQVILASSTDPSPLWRKLSYAVPGGYRMESVRKGPPQWHLEITRRPPDQPLVAQPG